MLDIEKKVNKNYTLIDDELNESQIEDIIIMVKSLLQPNQSDFDLIKDLNESKLENIYISLTFK